MRPDVYYEAELAEAIIETIPQPVLVLDSDLIVRRCNAAFLECFQVSRADTDGRPIGELGNGQWNIPALRDVLQKLRINREPIRNFRVEHDFERIGHRIMLLNADVLRREGGADSKIDSVLLALSDVTRQEEEHFALESLKEYAEKILDAVRDPILILDRKLRVRSTNAPFYRMFAVDESETVGRLVYELGNGQWDIPELRELLEKVLPENSAFDDYMVEHTFESIGPRVMLLNARRLDHEKLILLAIEDVTERSRSEKLQTVLVGELQHRVKNILMNVRTLARQSYRGTSDRDDFVKVLDARLDALGRTQDLLVRSPKRAVSLRELITLELSAVHVLDRVDLMDCSVELPASMAQPMAMTIHELTTNALKHGALSVEDGRVRIECSARRQDGRRLMQFRWRERGVRIAEPPRKRGFGTEIIEKSLPYLLGGTSRLTFHPDGLECAMEFALPPDES
jgi:two-component sensor histidine kinase/PAS domain-containing protein